MRSFLAFAILGWTWTGTAFAAEEPAPTAVYDQSAAMEPSELDGQRGGTETAGSISNAVIQGNSTDQTAANSGNQISVGSNAAKLSGDIHRAEVTGNHGITAVMQNTGDLVNMNNATSVNVFLR